MTPAELPHAPVLADRVTELILGAPEGVLVDATVGAAGHARAILEARAARGLPSRLVGIDRDPDALETAGERLAGVPGEVELVHARFDALGEILDDLGIGQVAGVLLDLGISSMHVDRADRGFSYRHEGPLDMRMDPTAATTAADLVNRTDQRELARIIGRYGEERFAQRIAAAVVRARPLQTTTELAEVVRDAIPAATRRTGPHPATRTFQALRIAVNAELESLERVLPIVLERLAPDGVCVVLAYHSLEDRIVKRAFADAATGCVCPPDLPVCRCGREPLVDLLTRKPERPTDAEVDANPRARSARLRAIRRRTTNQEAS
ncbi:MAG: 16S rRNA (cytosine(1402)-N(4))-methyltransferase RsmH [Nitriliruptorales bacterium]